MSNVQAAAVETWRKHIGRTKTQRQVIDRDVLHRFAAAVGSDLDIERIWPPLAHWAFFIDAVPPEQIGEDGHPLRGDFMPAVTLPRRMFAAGSIRFDGALRLGECAKCVTTIADVVHKPGQSGDLIFVEVDRTISQDSGTRISERQTIVYRATGGVLASVVPAETRASGLLWQPHPVDLFRFSAATFNSHRIHYDRLYAREIEGYPDLVVQGPFTAVKLFGLAEARLGRPLCTFSFRAITPLFVSQPVILSEVEDPGSIAAIRCDGVTAMKAKAALR